MNDIRKMSDILARHSPANTGTIHTAFLLEKVGEWLCIFILSAIISGCGDKPAPAKVVELTNISVSPTSLSFVLDGSPESQRIAATAVPEDATDVAFSWSSGNANIAAVSQDGVVTAKIAGSTTITVTANTSNVMKNKVIPVTVVDAKFILSAEVTNRQARNVAVDNAAKEIAFDLEESESKSGVNIKLTLGDGVAMVSPAAAQADYDLTKPAQIELLAGERQIVFTIKAGEYVAWNKEEEMVIGIYVPPPPHLLTTVNDINFRFKQIADAGINLVWGSSWFSYTRDDPTTPLALNACESNGMGFLIQLDLERTVVGDTEAELARSLERVNKYKNHPGLAGFTLNDEPEAIAFDRMAVIRREVDAILPEGKYAISNLNPGSHSNPVYGSPNYETYVDDYMRKVQPKVLSFDHYPLMDTNNEETRRGHDRNFVFNLITIRNAAIKYDVPFWGFIQAVGYPGRREPTMDEYRWLCNAHIAFGAKGISYFLYSVTGPDGWGGYEGVGAMLDWSGNTTFRYDYAKNINQELVGFTRKVMPATQDGFILTNQNAQITATIPATLRKSSYGNLSKIETTGEMLNGCFDLDGQKAVYLFNWSKDSSITARLVFDKTVTFELWGKDGLETEQTVTEWTVSFIPGEAKFLIFK